MTRETFRIASTFLLLCVVVGAAVARPPTENDSSFIAEMAVQVNLSFFRPAIDVLNVEPALSANPSVVWRPGLFGVGLGVKSYTTTRTLFLTTVPYLRTEFWWFTLSSGWAFRLAGQYVDSSRSMGPVVSLGISPEFARFAWGKIGVDATIDLVIVPEDRYEMSVLAPVFSSWGWTGSFRDVVDRLLANPVVGVGMTYSFPL
jgi:hypothetical protein